MKEEAAEKKGAEKARKAALIQTEKFKLERQGFFFLLYFVFEKLEVSFYSFFTHQSFPAI